MAELKGDHQERLVIIIPKALKRRLRSIARQLEDIDDERATITRVVTDILEKHVEEYERDMKRRLSKAQK